MIFCDKLLFLHVPKTGGMSVTDVLLKLAPPPVYYTWPIPESLPEPKHSLLRTVRRVVAGLLPAGPQPARRVIQVRGARHETLAEAAAGVREFGYEMSTFPVILAGMRNPYELEVSRFAFMRQGREFDRGPNQSLALSGGFEDFARFSKPHAGELRPFEAYYTLDGVAPPNLRLIRVEHIEADLRESLASVGIELDCAVPHINQSEHEDYRSYYTSAAEAAVFERYRWAFGQGLYPRMTF